MRLYRGITVPASKASAVTAKLHHEGMQEGDGRQWSMSWINLKPRLYDLRALTSLKDVDTGGGDVLPRVCACGDETGAAYYACYHNRHGEDDTPLLVTFEALLEDVIIDGRDFLYTIFQMGDPRKARDPVAQMYGKEVLFYLDRAWATTDQHERIGWCNVAVQDEHVVTAHAKNLMVIGGRHNTRFQSAFMGRLPVPAQCIIDVKQIDQRPALPRIDMSLYELTNK
jgi:hypothetical protein